MLDPVGDKIEIEGNDAKTDDETPKPHEDSENDIERVSEDDGFRNKSQKLL